LFSYSFSRMLMPSPDNHLFARAIFLLLLAVPALAQPGLALRNEQSGVAVDFRMRHSVETANTAQFREGEDVVIRFAISEVAGRTPLTVGRPAAWMVRRLGTTPLSGGQCTQAAAKLVGGSLFSRPELDLNSYFVLVMNEDATINVVDPLFGFGNSQLLSAIPLKSPGEDWVLTDDGSRLFVTMPAVRAVAAVQTSSWKVTGSIDIGARPERAALQPDSQYLWVAYSVPGGTEPSGVAVVSTGTDAHLVKRIPTGRGSHSLALSEDNRFAFVTNTEDRTVSVIDVAGLRKLRDIRLGGKPGALAWSALAKRAYVLDDTGKISVLEATRDQPTAEIKIEPGLGPIRLSPDGRLAFIIQTDRDLIHILDVSTNRIIQTGKVERAPDQVAFSAKLAYIRHRDSENVLMVPLDAVGKPGAPIPVVDFPGGQHPPGRAIHPSLADGIVQAAGENAVLVANPLDKAIYYYREGMAAPMGSFSTYSHEPRAVLVVDRSLKLQPSGGYETNRKLGRPGLYDMVFLMDSPRLAACFPVTVNPNPERLNDPAAPVIVTSVKPGQRIRAGESIRLQFQVLDAKDRKPASGLRDVRVMAFREPGVWKNQQWARSAAAGVYEFDFHPPEPGEYRISFECRSLGLSINNTQQLKLSVEPAAKEAQ
jgi:DNA-binding beta-propeller fold protein YncE